MDSPRHQRDDWHGHKRISWRRDRVVDLLADYLERIEQRPVFPNVEPAILNELFDEPLPETGVSSDSVLDELERKLLPYCTHVGHPGYFGLITPSPNLMGILGDFICSALNQNIGAYSIGPSAVAISGFSRHSTLGRCW